MPFMKVIPDEREHYENYTERNQEIAQVRIVKHEKGYLTLDDFTKAVELVRKG